MASKTKWPILDKFSMLLISTNRSKAYLQNLIKAGHVPSDILVLDHGKERLPEHTENDMNLSQQTGQTLMRSCQEAGVAFNEKETIIRTIKDNRIPYKILRTKDVNSSEVVDAVRSLNGDYIIYSGPGGVILRKDILSQGKLFLHAHPGWLPNYRGSTCLYYSLIAKEGTGCSVICFNEKVDRGSVFYRRRFDTGATKDIDYIFDPAIRAASLVDFFNENSGKSLKPLSIEDGSSEEEYFIIHPVLKHIALLRNKK